MVHQFLTDAYWSKGRTIDEVEQSIKNSMIFGLYLHEEQIGFARVLSDGIIVAHLLDVFVIETHRGKGYSKKLLLHIFNHPKLQVKKWILATKDAHRLYTQFGFSSFKKPELWMEKIT